jgi:endonuclease YncB( thermonuclease family)
MHAISAPRALTILIGIICLLTVLHLATEQEGQSAEFNQIACKAPYIIDGDTFACNGIHIRLASIDAPEMPDHCRTGRRCTAGDPFAARDFLKDITRGAVTCDPLKIDGYGRTVARCSSGGLDLSCAMVAAKHAVQRYGPLSCPADIPR